jgi:hypothetical protein
VYITAFDPDQDLTYVTLEVDGSSLPSWMSFDSGILQILPLDPDTYKLKVQATDQIMDPTTVTIYITIADEPKIIEAPTTDVPF